MVALGLVEHLDQITAQTCLKLGFSRRMWSWIPESTLNRLIIEQPNKVASLVPLADCA